MSQNARQRKGALFYLQIRVTEATAPATASLLSSRSGQLHKGSLNIYK